MYNTFYKEKELHIVTPNILLSGAMFLLSPGTSISKETFEVYPLLEYINLKKTCSLMSVFKYIKVSISIFE